MEWSRGYFDRVVVLNLDRRVDRWSAFTRDLEGTDWPFGPPVRVPAVDGEDVGAPSWWRQRPGAWGCVLSHAKVLEECLRDDVARVLVLEDDAVFPDDVARKVERFLSRVPPDWDQLYLGGQHIRPPRALNSEVCECVNVNRTHAYAVSRKFMGRMRSHILDPAGYMAHPAHQLDHRLGALHETGTVKAYGPARWIFGQREGRSNIGGRTNPRRFWDNWELGDMPMCVVIGTCAESTSAVGLLLRRMGLHFGREFASGGCPTVQNEDLLSLCEQVFPFSAMERAVAVEQSSSMVTKWCRQVSAEAAREGTIAAACYTQLCLMEDDFARSWPLLRVINAPCDCEGPVATCTMSQISNADGNTRTMDHQTNMRRRLQMGRRQWLDKHDHYSVDPARTKQDEQQVMLDLTEFLGVTLPFTGSVRQSPNKEGSS